MRRLTGGLLLLAACAGAAAAGPPSAAQDDRALIGEARLAQNRAMASADVDGAVSFWTDDVSLRRGLGQPVNGRDEYRQLLIPRGNRDSTLVYQRIPTGIEVSSHWPLAFESGTWTGHLGGLQGPEVIGGRYSAQWVKRAGRWLIRSEVFVALTCAGIGCQYASVP